VDNCVRHTCPLHRNVPDLRAPINTNFSGNRLADSDASSELFIDMSGFDFTASHENVHDACTCLADSDEDGNWNVPPLKQSQPNKPPPHLQYTAPFPTKQIPEGLAFKSYQCQDRVDKRGSTQRRRFSDYTEQRDGNTWGSKCCARRQSLSGHSSRHEDSCPRWRWKDTEFCDGTCGGRSVSFAAGHSLPVDTDSPSRAVRRWGRRRLRAFFRVPSPIEATEMCGEKGSAVDTEPQRPPIWCLDCHENLVAVGCANGRLEFWEGTTGTFKVVDQSLL
jgi:hypothetical protein